MRTAAQRLGGPLLGHRRTDAARRLGDGARTCTAARPRRWATQSSPTRRYDDGAELDNLVAYVEQIGSQESAPGTSTGTPNTGTGLAGAYFNNMTLDGRNLSSSASSAPNFSWSESPGPGVNANQFSARWTGFVEATATRQFPVPDSLERRRAALDQR